MRTLVTEEGREQELLCLGEPVPAMPQLGNLPTSLCEGSPRQCHDL